MRKRIEFTIKVDQFLNIVGLHLEKRKLLSNFLRNKKRSSLIAFETGRHHGFLVSIGCEVVGVDLSVGMLKKAKKKERKAHLVAADVENLPFKEEVFDAIYCRL